jgi:hypothetical protein
MLSNGIASGREQVGQCQRSAGQGGPSGRDAE